MKDPFAEYLCNDHCARTLLLLPAVKNGGLSADYYQPSIIYRLLRFSDASCLYLQRIPMTIRLSTWQRLLIVFICFPVAVAGFLIKLPAPLRHMDKELHTAFYFLAAALLNILFAGTKLLRHILLFIVLYFFGVAIEYGQDYSNHFFHSRIHGRFDPEDVRANLKGLVAFSILWLLYAGIAAVSRRAVVTSNTSK